MQPIPERLRCGQSSLATVPPIRPTAPQSENKAFRGVRIRRAIVAAASLHLRARRRWPITSISTPTTSRPSTTARPTWRCRCRWCGPSPRWGSRTSTRRPTSGPACSCRRARPSTRRSRAVSGRRRRAAGRTPHAGPRRRELLGRRLPRPAARASRARPTAAAPAFLFEVNTQMMPAGIENELFQIRIARLPAGHGAPRALRRRSSATSLAERLAGTRCC